MEFLECNIMISCEDGTSFYTVANTLSFLDEYVGRNIISAYINVQNNEESLMLWFGSKETLLEALLNF